MWAHQTAACESGAEWRSYLPRHALASPPTCLAALAHISRLLPACPRPRRLPFGHKVYLSFREPHLGSVVGLLLTHASPSLRKLGVDLLINFIKCQVAGQAVEGRMGSAPVQPLLSARCGCLNCWFALPLAPINIDTLLTAHWPPSPTARPPRSTPPTMCPSWRRLCRCCVPTPSRRRPALQASPARPLPLPARGAPAAPAARWRRWWLRRRRGRSCGPPACAHCWSTCASALACPTCPTTCTPSPLRCWSAWTQARSRCRFVRGQRRRGCDADDRGGRLGALIELLAWPVCLAAAMRVAVVLSRLAHLLPAVSTCRAGSTPPPARCWSRG